jgi:hypothetical protein
MLPAAAGTAWHSAPHLLLLLLVVLSAAAVVLQMTVPVAAVVWLVAVWVEGAPLVLT